MRKRPHPTPTLTLSVASPSHRTPHPNLQRRLSTLSAHPCFATGSLQFDRCAGTFQDTERGDGIGSQDGRLELMIQPFRRNNHVTRKLRAHCTGICTSASEWLTPRV